MLSPGHRLIGESGPPETDPATEQGVREGGAQKSEWGQNPKQVISGLCASISPSVKWGIKSQDYMR